MSDLYYHLIEKTYELIKNPLLYQIILIFSLLIIMNKILAKKLNDDNIPIIPRIFYVRETNIFNRTLPMRMEFIKEFLNSLQEKRNVLLSGNKLFLIM